MLQRQKKRHTLKNTLLSSASKVIHFIGQTFPGKTHDYTMLKTEFPPDEAWFAATAVLLDLGYQGVQTDYQGDHISIAHKNREKARRSPTLDLAPSRSRKTRR